MVNQSRSFELWAAVLAGGDGTRLQEYTHSRFGDTLPKQFCTLHGPITLLQRTVNRVSKLVPSERIVVTVPRAYVDVAAGQLGGRRVRFAIQPSNRDTTAAVFLALLHVYKVCPEAVVAIVPSDHFVSPEEAFLTSVLKAAAIASANDSKIVLVGCPPHNRDADLGFVIPAPGHPKNMISSGIPISRIVEKPSQAECGRLVDGGAYWNTFIMVASLTAFLKAGCDTVPGLLGVLEKLLPVIDTPGEQRAGQKAFEHLPSSDFTRDVLCKIPDRLLLVPMEEPCYWMDIGQPERVEQVLRLLSGRNRNSLSAFRSEAVVTTITQL